MARPSFSDKDKLFIYNYFNGECQDCHIPLNAAWVNGGAYNRPKNTFTIYNANIHHITPIVNGGKHNLSNWVLLCVPCHIDRHRKIVYALFPELHNAVYGGI